MSNIVFRVDASYKIGIGHFMRCLTLAKELNMNNKYNITFVYRKTDCYLNNYIKLAGFQCIELAKGVDNPFSELKHGSWLGATQEADADEFKAILNKYNIDNIDLIIVDHYGIDYLWHNKVKDITKKIFVIDDLGDRTLNCDYLLDQTFECNINKYTKLINGDCKQFLGTKYALLREEFQGLLPVKSGRKSLLVMFGGTDPDNLTLRALKVIEQLGVIDQVSVILSDGAQHLQSIRDYCYSGELFELHISPSSIAELMTKSTLAIGAGGTTSWERCAAGLPSVVIIQAYNQREIAINLQKHGVISYIQARDIEKELGHQINLWIELLSNKNNVRSMCLDVCDGYGATRIVREITND